MQATDVNSAAFANGIIKVQSRHSATVTADRLEGLLKEHHAVVFARIEFSADAVRAGLFLHPETLIIFGNPAAGTPLMAAQPGSGLDLPLKALFWEDAEGRSWASYNEPAYIVQRHSLPKGFATNLAAAIPLIERACGA